MKTTMKLRRRLVMCSELRHGDGFMYERNVGIMLNKASVTSDYNKVFWIDTGLYKCINRETLVEPVDLEMVVTSKKF